MENSLTLSEMQQNMKHEIFQDSLDCMELIAEKFVGQRLNYIQKILSGGKWKSADHYSNYEFSSGGFYDLEKEVLCRYYNYSELNLSDC